MALPDSRAYEIRDNVKNRNWRMGLDMRVTITDIETAVIIRAEKFDHDDLRFLIEQARGFSHFVRQDDRYDGWVRFVIW